MPIIKVENGYIYKKSTKSARNKWKFFLILFLVSITVVIACFFAFTKLNFTAVFGLNNFVIYEGDSFFAVSVESADTARELSDNATQVKLQDGAGYILKNGKKCFLIASCYETREDAEKVAHNLSDYACDIVEIKFDKLVLNSNYASEEIKLLKHSFTLVNRFFESVQNISLAFDRGEILDAEARQKLQLFKETCQAERENLAKAFSSSSDVAITYVKIFQSEVISNLASLIVSQNLSSDMKYLLISTLVSFGELEKSIKK